MYHPAAKTAFRDTTTIGASSTRRAMVLGAMFGMAAQGAMSLTRALAGLRMEADADTVTLLRLNRDAAPHLVATTAAQPTIIAEHAARFAGTLTADLTTLTTGHIVQDAADRQQSAIVLQITQAHADVLILRGGDAALTADFAAMATPIWAMRRGGLVINAIAALQKLTQDHAEVEALVVSGPILSPMNPAGLTPTEITVASALRDGLSPAAIGQALAMAMPTVRTHLRNLYNKTGLHGMQELTHRLHADSAAAAA